MKRLVWVLSALSAISLINGLAIAFNGVYSEIAEGVIIHNVLSNSLLFIFTGTGLLLIALLLIYKFLYLKNNKKTVSPDESEKLN